MHALIIIGAGPGGIALAAEASASGIDPSQILILEKGPTHNSAIRQLYPEKKLTTANYKGFAARCEGLLCVRDMTKPETLQFFDKIISDYHVNIQFNAEVYGMRRPAEGGARFRVESSQDQRDRYLSQGELRRLKEALDEKVYRKGTNDFNKTFCRLRMIVLIAVTTGMRASEIFGLRWSDVMYNEGLLAVRTKLKGGKMRYVPMLPELAEELRLFMPKPAKKGNVRFIVNRDLIFPPKAEAKGARRRVESSFEDLLDRAAIEDFRFHDLRHTFASWYMMNGGDLYELAKILGHSNIKMTERYAKLAKQHIARTSSTARVMWNLLEPACKTANVG